MNWLVIAEVLGGTALFLVGMQWLSAALRAAAGDRLRGLLTAATRSRTRGLALGTMAGFLAHSSAATVMMIGFINAGLLGLAAALPVLCGANVGTTLSMQLISFRLTDYALAAVAAGGILFLATRAGALRTIGQGILGFGVLFLGMKISGEAIEPYREALAPLLGRIDGTSLAGLLAGIALATAVTGIVQSSGAVIGMAFVLAGSGVFTSLWQTYPLVLGAHIGTTVTAVIASLGAVPDARRAAWANVLFNTLNTVLAAALAGVFVPLLQRTSESLVHQTANAHTAVMLVGAVIAVPLALPWAALMRRLVRSRGDEAPSSHLDPHLLAEPGAALAAVLREIGRCADLCVGSLRLIRDELTRGAPPRSLRRVQLHEQAIDEIKASVQSYLSAVTQAETTHQQALLAQSLNRCIIEVERIGDHVERLADLVGWGRPARTAQLDAQTVAAVSRLTDMVLTVVERLAGSFTSATGGFDAPSWAILEARNAYNRHCVPVKAEVAGRLSRREVPAARALGFSEIAATCDRIVRHCAVVAQEQRQPAFALPRGAAGTGAGREGASTDRAT